MLEFIETNGLREWYDLNGESPFEQMPTLEMLFSEMDYQTANVSPPISHTITNVIIDMVAPLVSLNELYTIREALLCNEDTLDDIAMPLVRKSYFDMYTKYLTNSLNVSPHIAKSIAYSRMDSVDVDQICTYESISHTINYLIGQLMVLDCDIASKVETLDVDYIKFCVVGRFM